MLLLPCGPADAAVREAHGERHRQGLRAPHAHFHEPVQLLHLLPLQRHFGHSALAANGPRAGRGASVLCCVFSLANRRWFCARAVAGFPTVARQRVGYAGWDFQSPQPGCCLFRNKWVAPRSRSRRAAELGFRWKHASLEVHPVLMCIPWT